MRRDSPTRSSFGLTPLCSSRSSSGSRPSTPPAGPPRPYAEGPMQFLAPWMLVGGAAVSVPIALHFFFKARHKPLPWAPMKFLKEAIEQTSRRLKFQEWILLALRCLVILLLALAIARPGQKSAGSTDRGEAVDAVFIFDTSFSMGAQDGDKTRLDRAKEAAL